MNAQININSNTIVKEIVASNFQKFLKNTELISAAKGTVH